LTALAISTVCGAYPRVISLLDTGSPIADGHRGARRHRVLQTPPVHVADGRDHEALGIYGFEGITTFSPVSRAGRFQPASACWAAWKAPAGRRPRGPWEKPPGRGHVPQHTTWLNIN
jgi:hypothetical protein